MKLKHITSMISSYPIPTITQSIEIKVVFDGSQWLVEVPVVLY